MRSRILRQVIEPISPTAPHEAQKRDPARFVLIAALFLALVGGFFLVRWRMGQTAKLPDNYLAYTEEVDPYKDNDEVKAARRLHWESARPASGYADAGCGDPVFEQRTYEGTEASTTWWIVYCPEDGRPTWLTEHAE